jgi:nucleoside-triphosphatase THEP1
MKKKGYAAGGMTVPQLRAAAKAKGYKIMKG